VRLAPIGLGDVLRAIAALAPDEPARWPAIAAALGFELPRDEPLRPTAAGAAITLPAMVGQGVAVHRQSSAARREASLPVLAPQAAVQSQSQPFLVEVSSIALDASTADAAVPALLPLLAPATAPSIVRAAAVMPQARGPLDTDALVRAVARRRLPARLPRRRRDTVAHDVVLLQDLGEGMDVFGEDVEGFADALRQAAGRHAVRTGAFLGRPAEALAALGVHRGSAVVVLTDLGLSPLARPDERGSARWLDLAALTQRAGARATLLVPWPAERWPADVAARLALATWDRGTNVAQVLRAVREHG